MEITTIREDSSYSYIAFFDLDLTLAGAISGRSLAKKAASRGFMKPADIATALLYGALYRLRIADQVKIVGKMTSWVKGAPEDQIQALSDQVFREIMLPAIYKDAYNEVTMHKEAGAKTVILSSSLSPICKAVADHLGIDDVICSELEVENGVLTGRPKGTLCFGEEKLVRLKAYCEKNNSTLSSAWYYGDAIVDGPALSIVGHPVCINPDKKLRKLATEKGWTIYLWK